MLSMLLQSIAPDRFLLTLSLLFLFGFTQFTLGVQKHVCKEAEIELAIVQDASSSIRPKDFKSSLKFLQDYLRQFDVGADKHMRVALVTFAKIAHPENGFNLTTYSTEEEVIKAIGKIRYLKERYTNTGHGLQYMRQSILPKEVTRSTAHRVALVITDGNSQKPKRTAAEAKAARDDGIALFVIGIGKSIRERELLDIGGDPTRVARLETFHQLHAFIRALAVMTCIKTNKLPRHIICGNRPLELVVLLDASSLVSEADYDQSIKFLQGYLQKLDIGYSSNSVRVSVVPYSSNVHTQDVIQLSSYDTGGEIADAVGKIQQQEAREKFLWKAIDYMRRVVLDSYVVRPGVPKIAMVLTDGLYSDPEKTAAESKLALEYGILMHVVAVGQDLKTDQLVDIAGDISRVTTVPEYDHLQDNIKNLAHEYCLDKNKIDSLYKNDDKLTTWIYISDCLQPTPLDIYFAYSQAALGPKYTGWVTEFITTTLSVRKLSFEHRYGVISDSCDSFDLDDYKNVDDIRHMLTVQNDNDKIESVLLRLSEGFVRDKGSRSDSLKVAVIIVDGRKSGKSLEVYVAKFVKNRVKVFIADPYNTGVTIPGATTLKGNAQLQSAYLVKDLCSLDI